MTQYRANILDHNCFKNTFSSGLRTSLEPLPGPNEDADHHPEAVLWEWMNALAEPAVRGLPHKAPAVVTATLRWKWFRLAAKQSKVL